MVPAVGSGHNAALTFPVPNQAALIGLRFYLQGFAIDVGGNPANCIVTRALDCRVGSA